MKAITGYLAITCVSIILAAVAVKGTTPTVGATAQKSTLQANIKARQAALDEI